MLHSQRYVSKELTHFTGKRCRKPDGTPDHDAQYQLLIEILRQGRLLPRQDYGSGPPRIAFRANGSFAMRTMIDVDAIYFCDIPVPDFKIHMAKYSEFGLGFLKSFLVEKGANPAFYIAGNSVIPATDATATTVFSRDAVPTPLTRYLLMDQLIKTHMGNSVRQRNMTLIEGFDSALLNAEIVRSQTLDSMIRTHFLSFCVPFDCAKDDNDDENYYMEREWRVIGDVTFDLQDVWRIVIPRAYAACLRNDIPDYAGQVTFSDT